MRKIHWKRKNLRPEELMTPEEYARETKPTSGMERIKKKLTLELISLMEISPPAKVIDLGCGWGFSSSLLKNLGFDVIGIDISEEMVNYTRSKGIKAVKGDFCELEKYFQYKEFDHGISVSSLQWISKDKSKVDKFARGSSFVIKKKLGIQFYPYSLSELINVLRILKKYYSSVDCHIIEKGKKKERIYIICEN